MFRYKTCNHVRTNGTVCQSPALKGANFCYFHQRERQRLDNLRQARTVKLCTKVPGRDDMDAEILESLALPVLEDAAAIQVAISAVLRAFGAGHIRPRRAGLMLYSLQIAAMNLKNVRLNLYDTDAVAGSDPEPIAKLVPFEPEPQQSLAGAAMGVGPAFPEPSMEDQALAYPDDAAPAPDGPGPDAHGGAALPQRRGPASASARDSSGRRRRGSS